MRSEAESPELSVIIPTVNEAMTLPCLLADLGAQTGVGFEILVSDGGSTDGTGKLASEALVRNGLSGDVLTGPAGRGRQLNCGAARARGKWLLFLHADSRLPDPTALAESLTILRGKGNPRLVGRFTMRFDLPEGKCTFDYYLCEVKARLGLPCTIHGDQGMLMTQAWFRKLGGFREDLPVLEDTLLAETIREHGEWCLLPAAIVTSPRRFQVEGFRERQTLSALLVNFAMAGWFEPLLRAPAVYCPQNRTGRLDLAPFFHLIDDCLRELPIGARLRIWHRTGAFVRANAWQLVLRRTARRAFAAGLPSSDVPIDPVLQFRQRFDFLTDHSPGRLIATFLTWLWYRSRSRQIVQGA
jgi:rSAM/selenodomain-associated transferase 2